MESPGTPSSYPAPPLPVLTMNEQIPVSETSPPREVAGSPVLDVFPSYMASPTGSVYGPVASPSSPSLREDDVSGPPSSPDQYLPRDGALLLVESTDLPLLAIPLTPRPIVEEMVLGSAVGSPAGEPVAATSHSMPDLSREDPFDVHQDASDSGASPRVLNSLPGCQYRMTSYDEDADRSELSLILSNLQVHVLGQFVTSLNRMLSEVIRVAFAHEPFPMEAVSPCLTCGVLYGGYGFVASTVTQGIPGPLPSSFDAVTGFLIFHSSGDGLLV